MNEVRKRFCKSSLPAIVPHGMWVNHRRTSKPFSVRHAPCPGPTCSSRHQLLFQSNSCRVAIDHCSPPFPRFASRSIFLFFPFLSLSLPLFALFSLSHFPRDKFETNATSHVFAEERLVPIGTRSKNRFAIFFTGHVFHSRLPWRVGFGLID